MPRIGRLNIVQCLLAAGLALGASLAHATYWNVFNIEGESSEAAHIVTYSLRADMLADTNRAGDFTMSSFGRNIVGSGSDGSTYWNVFNIEGESTEAAHIVTYGMLADMLADTNRAGDFTMSSFGRNIVDSGSDGSTYWNVFNIEGESTEAAHIVTYGLLADMLADTNRTGDFTMSSFGRNIVGSGSDVVAGGPTGSIPEPGSLALVALAGLLLTRRTPWRRRTASSTIA